MVLYCVSFCFTLIEKVGSYHLKGSRIYCLWWRAQELQTCIQIKAPPLATPVLTVLQFPYAQSLLTGYSEDETSKYTFSTYITVGHWGSQQYIFIIFIILIKPKLTIIISTVMVWAFCSLQIKPLKLEACSPVCQPVRQVQLSS